MVARGEHSISQTSGVKVARAWSIILMLLMTLVNVRIAWMVSSNAHGLMLAMMP